MVPTGDADRDADRGADRGAEREVAGDLVDLEAVRVANQAFYDAFEREDLDAMSDVWEHGDRVTCGHPGWPVLRGWGAIAASWTAIFGGVQRLQFILTNERIEVVGDVAWVTLDENLLDDTGDSTTVTAINLFVRTGAEWRLVAHHGSGVSPEAPRLA